MTQSPTTRRRFLRDLGISAAAAPFLAGLPGLQAAAGAPRQRLIIMFSPNGTVPGDFWPTETGSGFSLTPVLSPLERFRDRMLVLRGIANRVEGDGDRHMRGMSCLLTGTELFPGNIQGGSDTPAGWASGISIDQEIKNALQADAATRTRFGSLEFGVAVPNRADPWTRMSYAGPNKPVAPLDDPYQMLGKLYGRKRDRESLGSILDDVRDDLARASAKLGNDDRAMLDDHLALVREMETELAAGDSQGDLDHPVPELDPDIELVNDNTPRVSRMQIDLLVNAMANDMTRVATLQFMRSVGQARMHWLGVEEGHHTLSHEPDDNSGAQEKLKKINTWFAGELAYLAGRLADTPEPGGSGNMLDNTLIVWLNELGKGNEHTLDDLPFVVVGGAPGFSMGRSLDFGREGEKKRRRVYEPHNRLWLSVAAAMGHPLGQFGNEEFCQGGALDLS